MLYSLMSCHVFPCGPVLFLIAAARLIHGQTVGELYSDKLPSGSIFRIRVDRDDSVLALSPTRLYRVFQDRLPEVLAGNGVSSFVGDDIPATLAGLNNAQDFVILADGTIIIADTGNYRLRVLRQGRIGTFAGTGSLTFTGSEGTARSTVVYAPLALAVGPQQEVLFADGLGCIRAASNDQIRKYVGKCSPPGTAKPPAQGDGLKESEANIVGAETILSDSHSGSIYFNQSSQRMVHRIQDGTVYAVTGLGENTPGSDLALTKSLQIPRRMSLDVFGNLYILDSQDGKLYRIENPTAPGARIQHILTQTSVADFAFQRNGDLLLLVNTNTGYQLRRISGALQFAAPRLNEKGIVSATGTGSVLSPGSWATLFGRQLAAVAPGVQWVIDESGLLPSTLADVQVMWNGTPSAISFAGPNQINVLVPPRLAVGGPATVRVTTSRGTAEATVNIAPVGPALFTLGSFSIDEAAALHVDGSLVSRQITPNSRPATSGEVISIFGTGFGPTVEPLADLQVFPPSILTNEVVVQFGAVRVLPLYAGVVAPGLVQLNVLVPRLAAGPHQVVAVVQGRESQQKVTITVR